MSARDARALAGQMGADPDLIARQPKGSFATYIRGLTERAVPMSFPFFTLEGMARTKQEEREAIREASRTRYAEPWRRVAEKGLAVEISEAETGPGNDNLDPLAPSDEW